MLGQYFRQCVRCVLWLHQLLDEAYRYFEQQWFDPLLLFADVNQHWQAMPSFGQVLRLSKEWKGQLILRMPRPAALLR